MTLVYRQFVIVLIALSNVIVCECNAAVVVDAGYPGGNIKVISISDDVIHLQPDRRGTSDWWFYWNFRVRGAAGHSITFQFDGRSPMGARGPAVSVDGSHWKYAGLERVRDSAMDASFRYDFPPEAQEIRFAFCPPYVESNWRQFETTLKRCPEVSISSLCSTGKQRQAELVRIRPKSGQPQACVLLTARHHSCETMASYVLQGLLGQVSNDDETGRWLRERIEFLAVPFMDKDGVEEGDQGKNRPPHDHWLDYRGESRYHSVKALRELVSTRSPQTMLAIDMHCSYLREASQQPGCSEELFFADSMNPNVAAETAVFKRILRRDRRGPIPYDGRSDLPFGVRWNTEETAAPSFVGWASQLPGVRVAAVLEVPYANAGGVEVTDESAMQLGKDLAVAIQSYFETVLSDRK